MMDTGLCNHKKGVVSQAWMQELADGFSSYKNPYELQHFANFGLQRIIDFSMFLKTLMVDKRMESKVIAKSSAALTLLQRHYQHGEQLRDVHYQEFCSFDPYQQLGANLAQQPHSPRSGFGQAQQPHSPEDEDH